MWQRNEFLEVLPHIEADNLLRFIPRITSRTFFECYVSGNMTSKEAEFLVQDIEKSFVGPVAPSKPLFPSQDVEERIVRLDSRTNHYYPVEDMHNNANGKEIFIMRTSLLNGVNPTSLPMPIFPTLKQR